MLFAMRCIAINVNFIQLELRQDCSSVFQCTPLLLLSPQIAVEIEQLHRIAQQRTRSTRQASVGDSLQINKFCKKIVEFHDHIWNHHEEKYIETSTNMPVIGSLILEIDAKISEMWESKQNFAQ